VTITDAKRDFSYDLPHRAYDAQIYPIIAPNGSTIIIYGHRDGLTVIWRGGRPFKQSFEPGTSSKSNEVITIPNDDDEDDVADPPQTGLAAFDEEEPEFDPEAPYDEIVHTEEVPFDVEVHRIALPRIPSTGKAHTGYSVPPILDQKMVIAAACADGSVRLVTVDLTPRKGTTRKDIGKLLIITPQQGVLAASQAMTMTWTGGYSLNSSRSEEEKPPAWSFLLANHTSLAGGSLSVYQINLNAEGTELRRREGVSLLRVEHVDLQNCVLSFSTSHYPSRRHTQLLIGSTGAVRVYEPVSRAKHQHVIQQISHGAWLASFYVPFESHGSGEGTVGRRKRILDAKWTSDGQGVLVLLSDGQWGLWDTERTRAVGSSGRDEQYDFMGGVSGGGITHFALSGFVGARAVENSAKLDLTGSHSVAKEGRKLTPMTPITRKAKQQALFNGGDATSFSERPKGGIAVSATPSGREGLMTDDSILIHYENALYPIPSFLSHRQSAVSGNNSGILAQLRGFDSYNEDMTSVSQAPLSSSHRLTASSNSPLDILISTSHRLCFISPIRDETQSADPAVRRLFGSNAASRATDLMDTDDMDVDGEDVLRMDQDMLSKGQLDLGGLDRMLSGMNGGEQTAFGDAGTRSKILDFERNTGSKMSGRAPRRVGFAAGI
jgi:hypothetical protein